MAVLKGRSKYENWLRFNSGQIAVWDKKCSCKLSQTHEVVTLGHVTRVLIFDSFLLNKYFTLYLHLGHVLLTLIVWSCTTGPRWRRNVKLSFPQVNSLVCLCCFRAVNSSRRLIFSEVLGTLSNATNCLYFQPKYEKEIHGWDILLKTRCCSPFPPNTVLELR